MVCFTFQLGTYSWQGFAALVGTVDWSCPTCDYPSFVTVVVKTETCCRNRFSGKHVSRDDALQARGMGMLSVRATILLMVCRCRRSHSIEGATRAICHRSSGVVPIQGFRDRLHVHVVVRFGHYVCPASFKQPSINTRFHLRVASRIRFVLVPSLARKRDKVKPEKRNCGYCTSPFKLPPCRRSSPAEAESKCNRESRPAKPAATMRLSLEE